MEINIINQIAINAGKAIMEIYSKDSSEQGIEKKADNSPLTLADKAANDLIVKGLKDNFPHIPIISEEEKNVAYENRRDWGSFWLVDPLDGTKEFIKRNGEFTVNIALVENGIPTLGVIYAPVLNTLYFGDLKNGAFKTSDKLTQKITVKHAKDSFVAVGSRSHQSSLDQEVLAQFDVKEMVSMGSSLKFCLVAEGTADIYIRTQPTMEWDTAAGHAIVLAAGGRVNGISYNKPDLLNSGFECFGF
ncbi:MAG: 3'(2'),5'-bisphosphate nucleotidase CysQ [Cytophagales bacterium]